MGIETEIQSNPDVLAAIVDKDGNALIKYKGGEVDLHLSTENKKRRLGHIKGDVLFIERSRDRHLHRKSNSYGFNYYLLKKSAFKWVALMEDDNVCYVVPKQTILSMGKIMYFKNSQDGNSFEVQIFLNRDIIAGYKKDLPDTEK